MYQQRTELTNFTLDSIKEEAAACRAEQDTISELTELEGLPVSLCNDVIIRQSETAVKNQRLIKPFQPLRSGRVGIGHTLRTELSPERAWNESLHAAGFLIDFTEPGDETINTRSTVPFDQYDWYLDGRIRETTMRWAPETKLMLNIGKAALTANSQNEVSELLKPCYSALLELYPEPAHRMALRNRIQMTRVVSEAVRQAGIIDFTSKNYQTGHRPTLEAYETFHKLGVEPFRYDEIVDCFKPASYELLSGSELWKPRYSPIANL